jgi:hypothetical protein
MANEFLKEMLVGIGFKVDESSYKKQQALVAGVEKQLVANDKAARERDAAEKARTAAQTLRAAETAAMLRTVGAAVAAFATVAATAMGAVAIAIKNSLGEFDKLYYAAGRTGASVNNLKALGYAFKQTGSSAEAALSAVDNFSRARRSNPGIDAMLRGYGIDTKGDTSEVLMNSIDAIRKKHPQFAGEQVAGLLGISPDEYDHLIRYRTGIANFTAEYKKLQGAMGVNGGETANAAKEIMRQFGRLSAVVEVFADKVTQAVAPAIEFLATKLGSLVEFITDEDKRQEFSAYFDPIIGATKTLVKWVETLYDMFVKVFDYVRNSPFGKLLGAINPGFIREGILSALQPSSAEASEGGGATGEKPGFFRRGLNALKRGLGIGGEDMTPTPGSSESIRGRTFADKAPGVMKRLMADFNLSKNEAAIVLGNLGHESAGFTAFNEGGGGPGRGWAQWTDPGRKRRFYKYAADNKLDIKSDEANYGFLKWELENTHRSSIRALKRARGYDEKMIEFEKDFEGAGVKHYGRRFDYARRAAEAYDRAQQASPVAPTIPPRSTPRFQMNPGGFNVMDYMHSQPMGSSSTSTDNSKRVDMKGDTHVHITTTGDATATAASFKRAAGDVNAMRLRDVQTAIR